MKFLRAFSLSQHLRMEHVSGRKAIIPLIQQHLDKYSKDTRCQEIVLGCSSESLSKVLEGFEDKRDLITIVRAGQGPLTGLGAFDDSPTIEFPTLFRDTLLSNGQYSWKPIEDKDWISRGWPTGDLIARDWPVFEDDES